MAGAVGTLKVLVVRGKRLAIRDFTSSDPYVVVRLGNQTLKTKVINSCLNPVWNEELTFCVTEPIGDLKFEVFIWVDVPKLKTGLNFELLIPIPIRGMITVDIPKLKIG